MGLFDDILGIAKELNDIKTEVTDTIGGAIGDLAGLKDEASNAVSQLQDEASTVKDDLLSKVSDVTSGSKDSE